MTHATLDPRQFTVHARNIDRHHARVIIETSFEAAAVAYIEDHPHDAGAETEVSVVVREMESGREHCFRIDLETGETAACS